jgi:hypothetical protein
VINSVVMDFVSARNLSNKWDWRARKIILREPWAQTTAGSCEAPYFVINISDVHQEMDIIAKIIRHYSS